ncbi:MAG: HEAT repeat domain-containing protein [Calditrichota bacterium]
MKKTDQKNLILYHLDELDSVERAKLDDRLQQEPELKKELEKITALHDVSGSKSLPEVSDETLNMLRQSVSRKLRAEQQPAASRPFWSFLQPGPALQFGFAALLLLVGFLFGRLQTEPAPQQNNQLAELLTASREIQAGNSDVNPLLAGVEKLRYDPQSGTLEISYTTVNDIRLRGAVEDPSVRKLLQEAVLEEERPNVRLHAVKAMELLAKESKLDGELIETLLFLLEREKNTGVRLRILSVLEGRNDDPLVKTMLMRIVLNDPDEAVRIRAMQTFTKGLISLEDMHMMRKVIKSDSNSYVRQMAEGVLEKLTETNREEEQTTSQEQI